MHHVTRAAVNPPFIGERDISVSGKNFKNPFSTAPCTSTRRNEFASACCHKKRYMDDWECIENAAQEIH